VKRTPSTINRSGAATLVAGTEVLPLGRRIAPGGVPVVVVVEDVVVVLGVVVVVAVVPVVVDDVVVVVSVVPVVLVVVVVSVCAGAAGSAAPIPAKTPSAARAAKAAAVKSPLRTRPRRALSGRLCTVSLPLLLSDRMTRISLHSWDALQTSKAFLFTKS